jgi:CheY-like chemotaxis protein
MVWSTGPWSICSRRPLFRTIASAAVDLFPGVSQSAPFGFPKTIEFVSLKSMHVHHHRSADHMSELKSQIAVVDDDCAVREALTRLLETSSYEVQTFPGASQLIATLSQRKPDCIVVDLQMPVMTGLELQHYLTRASILIPVIIVTAHDEPGSRERCIAAGVVDYLHKPLRRAVLVAAINSAIARPN